ncbi:acetylglutamate kinase [Dictyobacter alpinus]|uniref:Acetylglutamate kinase n=1 Tax=Dictyobacter alpinus TaxID=2014873 RepID=A0A402BB89_9CHLR|nr:acetylglutamate kinase [Dictyobacter alpinus]GCE28599.1 acetylglutamate kinase [Dictyobacter alpinus]
MVALFVSDDMETGEQRDSLSVMNLDSEMQQLVATMRNKLLVVKLGGSTLESERVVLQDIIWLRDCGVKVVLVHGGGASINEWLLKCNVPVRFEDGLRVTDALTLSVVRMVLCGQVNQELVALTEQLGGRAVGLSGMDDHMIHARVADERLGFVGAVDAVDASLLERICAAGYIPIIAPLGLDDHGQCLNINADVAASHIASALKADRLIFLSNVCGICQPDGEVIPRLNGQMAQALIAEGVISGGMLPKVAACLQALQAVPCVHIVDGRMDHVLLHEILDGPAIGTQFTR